jgi:hypothetical protein
VRGTGEEAGGGGKRGTAKGCPVESAPTAAQQYHYQLPLLVLEPRVAG